MSKIRLFASLLLSLVLALFSLSACSAQSGYGAAMPVSAPVNLFYPSLNTIGGNPKGTVTVVEFFDYRCGYCRMVAPQIDQLIKSDQDIRLVYRDLPILGPASVTAARAALAAQLQNKYFVLNQAFLHADIPLDDTAINQFALASGLNTQHLAKDMYSAQVTNQLTATFSMANALGVNGTPTFVIAATPSSKQTGDVTAYMAVSPSLGDLRAIVAMAKGER